MAFKHWEHGVPKWNRPAIWERSDGTLAFWSNVSVGTFYRNVNVSDFWDTPLCKRIGLTSLPFMISKVGTIWNQKLTCNLSVNVMGDCNQRCVLYRDKVTNELDRGYALTSHAQRANVSNHFKSVHWWGRTKSMCLLAVHLLAVLCLHFPNRL